MSKLHKEQLEAVPRAAARMRDDDKLALQYLLENGGRAMPHTQDMALALSALSRGIKATDYYLVRQGHGGAADPHHLGNGIFYLTDFGSAVCAHLKLSTKAPSDG